MPQRIAALPVLALALAAIDTQLVRIGFQHRPLGGELFGQAFLLWLGLGAIGLVLGLLASRLRRVIRRGSDAPREGRARTASEVAAQLGWTAGPVILHGGLNKHTALGGDLHGLLTLGAVFDLSLSLALVALLVFGARELLRRVPALPLALVLSLASVGTGLFWTHHGEGTYAPAAERELAGATPERPNVLLMIWDTSRAKSHQLTGYTRPTTPRLAELAESSVWHQFSRSASSYTLTSHISMLTGVYPSHHGARMLRQVFDPEAHPSVAEDFARAGYRTGAFVGTGVLTAQSGIISGFEVYGDLVDPPVSDTRGWALVHDVQAIVAKLPWFHANGQPHWFQDFQRPASEVLADAAEWIRRPDPRPWFCMINMYDVHWPYLPGEESRAKWVEPYDGPFTGYLFRGNGWDPDYELTRVDKNHARELYDAETWDLDREVGAFLDTLDLERTALIITSDHGEAFGEGGEWEHNDILECQVRVPLLVRPAGGVAGGVADAPTSGVDIAPTLLDLAGLFDPAAVRTDEEVRSPQPAGEHGPRARFFGHSLLRELPERLIVVEDRDHVDAEVVGIALYAKRFKLLREGLGDATQWKLFNLQGDPNGLHDVSAELTDVTQRLEARLALERSAWGADDERDSLGLQRSNTAALKALGYVDEDHGEPGAQP